MACVMDFILEDSLEMENLRIEFWKKIRPDVGVVPQRLRRVLDTAGLTGCYSMAVMIEDTSIDELETMVDANKAKIFQEPPVTFKFTSFDRGTLKRLAEKVRQNGIEKYITTENGIHNRSDLAPFDPSKEKKAISAKLASRYANVPDFDVKLLHITIDKPKNGQIIGRILCYICMQLNNSNGKIHELKAMKYAPNQSWSIYNPAKHFDAHFNIVTQTTRTKRLAKALPNDSIAFSNRKRSRCDSKSTPSTVTPRLIEIDPLPIHGLQTAGTSYEQQNSLQEHTAHDLTYQTEPDQLELHSNGQENVNESQEFLASDISSQSSQTLNSTQNELLNCEETKQGDQESILEKSGDQAKVVEQTEPGIQAEVEEQTEAGDLSGDDSDEEAPNILDDLSDAPFLKVLASMHINNKHKKPKSRRYSLLEKDICAYKFLTAGNLDYTTRTKNQTAMSSKTVRRYLKQNTPDIQEGVINVKGLKQYLESNGFPLKVSLCEDATRITPCVEYDYTTNSLRGLVAELDKNGVPKPNSFIVNDPYKLKSDIENRPMGNYVYVVMALPLSPKAAPFVLYHACSNNRFTADDILRRWKYEEDLLKEEGIEVVCHCADGDPRLLKAMKIRSGLFDEKISPRWGKYYVAIDNPKSPGNLQDPPHLCNKMRNRYAHSTKLPDLKIGDYTITTDHLKQLLILQTKDKHLLTINDIEIKDKMKFGHTLKLINPEVLDYLEADVPGSKGTILFLSIIRRIYRAFVDESLTAAERVVEIWTALFIVRGWRNWCGTMKNLKQFITPNAYVSLELNAHALINFIVYCRERNTPDEFIISVLSSQPCEELFRLIRSLSTTQETVVNITAKQMTERLKRIKFQIDIMYRHHEAIYFPTMEKLKQRKSALILPSDDEIRMAMSTARTVACNALISFGIGIQVVKLCSSVNIRLQKAPNSLSVEFSEDDDDDSFEEQDNACYQEPLEFVSVNDLYDGSSVNDLCEPLGPFEFVAVADPENVHDNIQNDSNNNADVIYYAEDLFPNCKGHLNLKNSTSGSRHTFKIADGKGKVKNIKKATFLWMLTQGPNRISTDRIRRFQQKEITTVSINIGSSAQVPSTSKPSAV